MNTAKAIPTARQREHLKQYIKRRNTMNHLDTIARINYYQQLVYEVNCLSLPSTRKAAALSLASWMEGVTVNIDEASFISLSVIGDGLHIDEQYTVTTN